ncbi:hypothetical protein RI054_01g01130 [Pseudoscourfieldia marina]
MQSALTCYDAATTPMEIATATALLVNAARATLTTNSARESTLARSLATYDESTTPLELATATALLVNAARATLASDRATKAIAVLLENVSAINPTGAHVLSTKEIARLTVVAKSLHKLAKQVLEERKRTRGFADSDPSAKYAPMPHDWGPCGEPIAGKYRVFAACLHNVWRSYCADIDPGVEDYLTFPASGIIDVGVEPDDDAYDPTRPKPTVRLEKLSCHVFEQTNDEAWVALDDDKQRENDLRLKVELKRHLREFSELDSKYWHNRHRRIQRARLSVPKGYPNTSLYTNQQCRALPRVRNAAMEEKRDVDVDDDDDDDGPICPVVESCEYNFQIEEMTAECSGRIEVGDLIMELTFEPIEPYDPYCSESVRLSLVARPIVEAPTSLQGV